MVVVMMWWWWWWWWGYIYIYNLVTNRFIPNIYLHPLILPCMTAIVPGEKKKRRSSPCSWSMTSRMSLPPAFSEKKRWVSREINGKSMGNSWENHGTFMGNSWEIHGKTMGKSWENHGKFMGNLWEIYGKFMANPWEWGVPLRLVNISPISLRLMVTYGRYIYSWWRSRGLTTSQVILRGLLITQTSRSNLDIHDLT